jgi:RimJ/RimL family protein N-acetyltransferase
MEGGPVSEMILRPLAGGDLDDLYEILSERDDMTWEGQRASLEYAQALLNFRIQHYARYGFGVYAVLSETGALIGQAGLQVLGEEDERVEVVIFLSSKLVGSGSGSILLARILDELCVQDIADVWATVRHGNRRAERLVRRFGFAKDQETVHFNMPCSLWRLDMRLWQSPSGGRVANR